MPTLHGICLAKGIFALGYPVRYYPSVNLYTQSSQEQANRVRVQRKYFAQKWTNPYASD